MARTASGTFKSNISDERWLNIHWLLTRGHRVKDIVNKVYGEYGATEAAIYTKNSKYWNIELKRGSSRGPKCPSCRLYKLTYRQSLCRECFNASKRRGYASGERHWNWQGGKTKTAEYIRLSPEYKKWRTSVFKRDRYTCQECGTTGIFLNADHIKPQSLFPELRLETSNGRTLCVPCHRNTSTYGERVKKLKREDFLDTI